MLYGRRLDESLEHVDGSRYALVHAVAKRARQITLWLTADPAELRAESAPPPAPGELVSRDPVALAEAEILQGEVGVRWDPEGLEEPAVEEVVESDPLLIEGIADDEEAVEAVVDLEGDVGAEPTEEAEGATGEEIVTGEADIEDGDGGAAESDEQIVESLDAVDDGDDESDEEA
jgi:DNA-directed RNA polymerase subunit K/omega